ncbi:MAG: LysE family translocator [Egibacteraceae bacterium]
MPTASTFALFIAAALAFLVVPGPSVLYIVARSIHQGRAAGVLSALGVAGGSLVHTAAATLGLSALLLTSATAFTIVKLAGAAYLVWIGLQRLLGRHATATDPVPGSATLRRAFTQGMAVNILNPKTALFFLAFLPQFTDPARGPIAGQIAVLGVLLAVLGVASDGTYALVAGSAGDWLERRPRFTRTSDRAAGAVYIALGITAAFTRRPAIS